LFFNVIDHKKVPKAKVDNHVLLDLVHVGGVDENRSITPLHEAIMEKQMQLNFGNSRIESEFHRHNFLHN
jgi:hypothetical protein